jgi:hypothetical protein
VSVERLRRRRAPRGSGEQLREEILDATTELLLKPGTRRQCPSDRSHSG